MATIVALNEPVIVGEAMPFEIRLTDHAQDDLKELRAVDRTLLTNAMEQNP